MRVSRYHGTRLGLLVIPSLAGVAIGGVFAFLISPDPTVYTLIQGAICGFLIGLTVFYMEYFIFDRIRKLSIIMIVITRSIIFTVVIVLSYIISDVIVFGARTLVYDIKNFLLPSFGTAIFFILGIMLVINISRLLGQRALARLLIGLYHKPVVERRIFMFLDLSSSTAIAEEIGDIKFHSFLNDFFFDVTRPIVESKGEIYKYVGDEIIVSWTIKRGTADANCLECFFQITDRIDALREKYEKRYGVCPRFSAGIHCGNVVVGEMGDYKREVAFLGDVVNTTSRIQSECKASGRNCIVSDELKRELPAGPCEGFLFESLGSMALRGKKQESQLFSVTRARGERGSE
ncbi:MAG: adenylate/guanylate cyclase domain-containing protein [Spirochaetes bacterium]|nr:adenylate/guanylate cyclase domain-containing protein [Spirochaetota bacterium]